MVLGGYVVKSLVDLSIIDSNNGSFNRVGVKSVHEDIPNEFAVVADVGAMDVGDIIGICGANRESFWVNTGLAEAKVWMDVFVEFFGMGYKGCILFAKFIG